MKYHVNEDCIGCGLCTNTCPSVFRMTDAGVAEATDEAVRESDLHAAAEAMENCPVSAIEEA